AVKGTVEDDDRGSAARRARSLDGVLDGLRARVQEDALLLLATPGRELCEAAADLHVRLVHSDHEALVEVAVGLFVDRRYHRGQPMAGVLAAEPPGEVDVGVAVDVLDARALGTGDDERRSGHARSNVSLSRAQNLLGRVPLLQRHPRSLQLLEMPFSGPRGGNGRGMLAAGA